MTEIELLVGAILPFALEFIFRFIGENEKVKFIVSLVLPILIGAGMNYQALGTGDVLKILESGTIIFTAAQGVYKLYFKDSALQKRIAK